MKIRQGFVSNSSSSSFVIAVEEWTHCDVVNKMKFASSEERERFEKQFSKTTVFGKACYLYDEWDSQGYGSYSFWCDEYGDDEAEALSMQIEEYKNKVKKQGNNKYFSHDVDF